MERLAQFVSQSFDHRSRPKLVESVNYLKLNGSPIDIQPHQQTGVSDQTLNSRQFLGNLGHEGPYQAPSVHYKEVSSSPPLIGVGSSDQKHSAPTADSLATKTTLIGLQRNDLAPRTIETDILFFKNIAKLTAKHVLYDVIAPPASNHIFSPHHVMRRGVNSVSSSPVVARRSPSIKSEEGRRGHSPEGYTSMSNSSFGSGESDYDEHDVIRQQIQSEQDDVSPSLRDAKPPILDGFRHSLIREQSCTKRDVTEDRLDASIPSLLGVNSDDTNGATRHHLMSDSHQCHRSTDLGE